MTTHTQQLIDRARQILDRDRTHQSGPDYYAGPCNTAKGPAREVCVDHKTLAASVIIRRYDDDSERVWFENRFGVVKRATAEYDIANSM